MSGSVKCQRIGYYLQANATVTLYRGDAAEIEEFRLRKTSLNALLGRGIYLTDSPQVANSYRAKGNTRLEATTLGKAATKSEARRLSLELLRPWLNDDGTWRKTRSYQGCTDQETLEQVVNDQTRVKHSARKLFEGGMEISYQIIDPKFVEGAEGHVSTFEVPTDYLKRVVDAERPLPEIVPIFARVIPLSQRPSQAELKGRTKEQWIIDTYMAGWDNLPVVDCFTKARELSRKLARRNGRVVDGLQTAVRTELSKAGHTGFSYNGGLRLGGRGYHTAYVLWDERAVNQFRQ